MPLLTGNPKIWIAISTPFQANFFHPLIRALKDKAEFLVTARDHDRILEILDAKRISYATIGKHGGKEPYNKLDAYAQNVAALTPLVNSQKPDLMITERWPEAVRVAFGLSIPAWSLFYDEREYHVNRMVFPLSSKTFAPSFYTRDELQSQGVLDSASIVWFRGFHTAYLKSCPLQGPDPFAEMGMEHPIILIRSEPYFAAFFDKERAVVGESIRLLKSTNEYRRGAFSMVGLPRGEEQKRLFTDLGIPTMTKASYDNPVAYCDIVLGAAETMLMEAFVLQKPSVSAIYWDESKPVKELHKHIPHSIHPEKIRDEVMRFLDPVVVRAFEKRARSLTAVMENPIDIMENEVIRLTSGIANEKRGKRNRRSKMDLCMEIVERTSFGPEQFTSLMSDIGVSYSALRGFLEDLLAKDLMKESTVKGRRYYEATDRGIDVLSEYKKVKEALP